MTIHHAARWFSFPALVLAAGLGADLRAAEVARWTFDAGTPLEDVIGASDLTAAGDATVTTVAAPARRQGTGALVLDGTGDYVTTPDAAALDVTTGGLTISTWINAASFAGNPRILEKGIDSEYRLIATGGNLQFQVFDVGSVSAPVPTTGAWHHVVAVWDPTATPTDQGSVFSGVFFLYVDGVQVAAADAGANIAAGTLPATSVGELAIGGKSGNTDFFTGTIDDVRLFNTALSLAAINQLPPAASALAFATQPAGATAGVAFTTQPVVRTVDDNGFNSVVGLGATVDVTITREDGTGSFIGSPTTTINVGTGGTPGIATFAGLRLDVAGDKSLLASATIGGAVTAESQTFTVAVAAAAKLAFLQQPTATVAGAEITPDVTVRVLDAFDNLVSSSTATIEVAIGTNAGGSTLGGDASVDAIAGVATFGDLTLNKVGTGYTLTAASTGLTGATSSAFTITPAAAAKLAFVQQPTATVAGAEITPDVSVSVLDAFDNVVTGSTATIDVGIGTNAGGSTLGGDASVDAIAGVASFGDLTLNKVGTGYTLTAASTGLTGATSSAFTITVASAAKLAFVVQPTATVAGAEITPDVTVSVLDAFDNVVTGSTATIDVAIGTNPGTSTLGGDASVDAIAGVATFGDLTLNKVGTGYTLTAASTGLTGATTSTFAITPAAGSQLAFATQPVDSVAGATIPLVVAVQDAFGNPTAATDAITIAIGTNPGAGTLSGTVTVNAVAGSGSFVDLSINRTGSAYTLVASASGFTDLVSSTFSITPDVAHALAFTVDPTDAIAGATQAGNVEVEILDQHGNRVTTATDPVSLAFGTNPSAATLGGTTTQAAVAGLAVFPGLTVSAAGDDYSLVASSGALTTDTSATFDITAASGGGSGGGGGSSSGGCGLGSTSPFAALLLLLMLARLRPARRSDHQV